MGGRVRGVGIGGVGRGVVGCIIVCRKVTVTGFLIQNMGFVTWYHIDLVWYLVVGGTDLIYVCPCMTLSTSATLVPLRICTQRWLFTVEMEGRPPISIAHRQRTWFYCHERLPSRSEKFLSDVGYHQVIVSETLD